jgi:hypothetical protein
MDSATGGGAALILLAFLRASVIDAAGEKKPSPPPQSSAQKHPLSRGVYATFILAGEIFFAKVIDFIVLSSILDGMSYFGARCRLRG